MSVVVGIDVGGSTTKIVAFREQDGKRELIRPQLVRAAVSGSVDYLIAGDKMGPEKRKKAEKLGVKMLSEEEFMALIVADDLPAKLTEEVAPQPEQIKEETPVQGTLF